MATNFKKARKEGQSWMLVQTMHGDQTPDSEAWFRVVGFYRTEEAARTALDSAPYLKTGTHLVRSATPLRVQRAASDSGALDCSEYLEDNIRRCRTERIEVGDRVRRQEVVQLTASADMLLDEAMREIRDMFPDHLDADSSDAMVYHVLDSARAGTDPDPEYEPDLPTKTVPAVPAGLRREEQQWVAVGYVPDYAAIEERKRIVSEWAAARDDAFRDGIHSAYEAAGGAGDFDVFELLDWARTRNRPPWLDRWNMHMNEMISKARKWWIDNGCQAVFDPATVLEQTEHGPAPAAPVSPGEAAAPAKAMSGAGELPVTESIPDDAKYSKDEEWFGWMTRNPEPDPLTIPESFKDHPDSETWFNGMTAYRMSLKWKALGKSMPTRADILRPWYVANPPPRAFPAEEPIIVPLFAFETEKDCSDYYRKHCSNLACLEYVNAGIVRMGAPLPCSMFRSKHAREVSRMRNEQHDTIVKAHNELDQKKKEVYAAKRKAMEAVKVTEIDAITGDAYVTQELPEDLDPEEFLAKQIERSKAGVFVDLNGLV